jgi:hypothetical protein
LEHILPGAGTISFSRRSKLHGVSRLMSKEVSKLVSQSDGYVSLLAHLGTEFYVGLTVHNELCA